MSDLELQALIALVNAQTAELNMETARSVALGEPPSFGDYNQIPRDKLTAELSRRGILR